MASMKYHKDCKKWRVFWHVTLPNGEVDKGSKSFDEKSTAKKFKEHCEKRAKQIKNTVFVNANMIGADLEGADIRGADFTGVDISSLKNIEQTKNLDKAKGLNITLPE